MLNKMFNVKVCVGVMVAALWHSSCLPHDTGLRADAAGLSQGVATAVGCCPLPSKAKEWSIGRPGRGPASKPGVVGLEALGWLWQQCCLRAVVNVRVQWTRLKGLLRPPSAAVPKAKSLAKHQRMNPLHCPCIAPRCPPLPLTNPLPPPPTLHVFQITDTSAFKKGQELVEDLKDKYETSDHPMVHKVEVGLAGCRPGCRRHVGGHAEL